MLISETNCTTLGWNVTGRREKDWNMRVMCQEKVNRSNDIVRQTKTEKMREKKSGTYWEMKKEWQTEQYTC